MSLRFIGGLAVIAAAAVLRAGSAIAQAPPDALRASVVLASDYVHNGLLQTGDGPSLRFGLDYEHQIGFFAGATLANVEYSVEARFRTPRDIQATWYAGYFWRRARWAANFSVTRYRYPEIERDYDYTQAAAGISFRERYFLTVSQSSDYLEIYGRKKQIRIGVALPWIRNIEFGVNAGRLRYDGRRAGSYSHWDIGLSRPFGRLALDVRFHDSTLDRANLAGNLTKNQWVVSMTYPLLPLRQARDRR